MHNYHQPYSRISGSNTIVVCVHGIQGSPQQFRYLVTNLPAGIDYMCVLLPGHGATIKQFRKCGKKEWIAYFSDLCSDLRRTYERIYFVGHSLGCLIGIEAMMQGTIHFDGMLLIACPLKIRLSMRYLSMALRSVQAKPALSVYLRAMQDANSVSLRYPLEMLSCVKPYMGLLLLIIRANRAIRHLDVPVCLVQSAKDEIVSPRSIKVVRDIHNIKSVIVPNSGHFFYPPLAQEIIRRELDALMG